METRRSVGRKGRGRPQSITSEKSAVFLAAMENGFTLKESLIEAGISDDAYRRLLDKSADFRGQKEAAEMKLGMLAKSELAKKIKAGDGTMIRWYLERKCPEEFRLKREDDFTDLPQNITVVVPGGRHPRITPDPDDPHIKYADEVGLRS